MKNCVADQFIFIAFGNEKKKKTNEYKRNLAIDTLLWRKTKQKII